MHQGVKASRCPTLRMYFCITWLSTTSTSHRIWGSCLAAELYVPSFEQKLNPDRFARPVGGARKHQQEETCRGALANRSVAFVRVNLPRPLESRTSEPDTDKHT